MQEQNQPINTLPIKTASGMAATDYLLGIGSTEEYQMLIQDLGDYIIQHATSLLAGQSQTLESVISALNNTKATVTTGQWTPHIYDYTTKVGELSQQTWYKIGDMYILPIGPLVFPELTINTMLQIRNIPCSCILGGNVYIAGIDGEGGNRTIQWSDVGVYIRPNVKGQIRANGAFSALLFGK